MTERRRESSRWLSLVAWTRDCTHAMGRKRTPPLAAAHFGGGGSAYRPSGLNTEANGDLTRQSYTTTGATDYDVGWNDGGNWGNYTRNYPTGRFIIYMRGSTGNGNAGTATFSIVTGGQGTTDQTTQDLGTFTIPPTGSWQKYAWVPLLDSAGKLAVFESTGTNTLRFTNGGGYNANFYALFPAAGGGTNAQPVSLTVAVSGGSASITFLTQTGFSYQVEQKDSLTDASWTAAGSPISGDGANHTYSEAVNGGHRFYRVTITPAP